MKIASLDHKSACIAGLALGFLGSVSASAQTSEYGFTSITASDFDASGMGAGGGTVSVTYSHQSGSVIDELGLNFTVDFNFSGLSGPGDSYDPAARDFQLGSGNLSFGPTDSIYDNLPAANQDSIIRNSGSEQPREYVPRELSEGGLQQLGTFGISMGTVPDPEGYDVEDSTTLSRSGFNIFNESDSTEVLAGYWAGFTGDHGSQTTTISSGESQSFDYTAWNSSGTDNVGEVGLGVVRNSTVTFTQIPEPAPGGLLGIAGVIGLLFKRKRGA